MTLAYTTGTITLTNGSKTVTGTGTGWQTALISGGVIYPQVTGNPLPINTVNSDTSITAVTEWRGVTGTYSYALIRDAALDQQIVANTNSLATLLNELKSAPISALAALSGSLAAGRVPRGLSPTTMEWMTVSDAAKTLFDDTSIAAMLATLGVSAAVPKLGPLVLDCNAVTESGWCVASDTTSNRPPGSNYWFVFTLYWPNGAHAVQLAYGAFTVQQASMKRYRNNDGSWTAWGAAGSSLVGTVSQIGGIATGAGSERFTTVNGEYVRHACGLQECFRSDALTGQSWTALGSSYRVTGIAVSWAAGFVGRPVCSGHVSESAAYTVGFFQNSNDAAGVNVMSGAVGLSAFTIRSKAAGFWF